MSAELFTLLDEIEKEKGISKDVIIDALNTAFISAYKKNYGAVSDINVNIDEKTGKISVFARKNVVEEVEDRECEISVEDAREINPNYEVGDVVVFQDGKLAVTHRIVSISENEVITRGDANNTDDDPITLDDIKGEVVCVIPCVGRLVNMIKTPLGTLVIIALAVFLLERSFRAEKEKDKKQLDDIKAEIEKLKREQSEKC